MKSITYKILKEENEKLLATYIAYKGYFPNSVMIGTPRQIFNSNRTLESSYQVVNRQIKLLLQNKLAYKKDDKIILIPRAEFAQKHGGNVNSLFIKIETGKKVKEYKPILTKIKLDTKLNQIRFRQLTKSKRPSKSLTKAIKALIEKNKGAFVQISFTNLAKSFGVSRDTIRRRVKTLISNKEVSMIPSTRRCLRKLHKLEQPNLDNGQFVYNGYVFEVESPWFRVNSGKLMDIPLSPFPIPTPILGYASTTMGRI